MDNEEVLEMAQNACLEFMRAVKCGSGPGEISETMDYIRTTTVGMAMIVDSLSKTLQIPPHTLLAFVQSAIDCCEEEPPAEAN